MLLYRTPNLVIDKHEWHATVRIDHGRISKCFYFRPLAGPRRNWTHIAGWQGRKPKGLSEFFAPFKRHMLQAERSVVENARMARQQVAA